MSTDAIMKPEPRYRTLAPPCDVFESADEFLIQAEVPGIEQDDIELRLERSQLSITATRSTEANRPHDRVSTRYVRAFEIPETVDSSKVDAKLEAGVLSIHLPKAPQARVRKIAVTAG